MDTLQPTGFDNKEAMVVAGLNGSFTHETSREGIGAQWERFVPRLGNIAGQVGPGTYGICHDFGPGGAFEYLCGVRVKDTAELPGDFTSLEIPARRYAVFAHEGHVMEIPQVVQAIFQQWLPGSGQQMEQAPFIEYYSERFNPMTLMGGMEIWVPVKA